MTYSLFSLCLCYHQCVFENICPIIGLFDGCGIVRIQGITIIFCLSYNTHVFTSHQLFSNVYFVQVLPCHQTCSINIRDLIHHNLTPDIHIHRHSIIPDHIQLREEWLTVSLLIHAFSHQYGYWVKTENNPIAKPSNLIVRIFRVTGFNDDIGSRLLSIPSISIRLIQFHYPWFHSCSSMGSLGTLWIMSGQMWTRSAA